MAKFARHDRLTGLPNRAQLLTRLEHGIGASPGRLGVLFCDIDGFGEINRRLGREHGDEVLRAVAGRWSSALRGSDTLGRWGGDEFLIVCSDIDDPMVVESIGERLIECLDVPLSVSTKCVSLGASVGLALHLADEPLDRLIERANAAMCKAKRANGGLCIATS